MREKIEQGDRSRWTTSHTNDKWRPIVPHRSPPLSPSSFLLPLSPRPPPSPHDPFPAPSTMDTAAPGASSTAVPATTTAAPAPASPGESTARVSPPERSPPTSPSRADCPRCGAMMRGASGTAWRAAKIDLEKGRINWPIPTARCGPTVYVLRTSHSVGALRSAQSAAATRDAFSPRRPSNEDPASSHVTTPTLIVTTKTNQRSTCTHT